MTLRPSQPGFDPRSKTFALTRLPSTLPLADRQQFVSDVRRGLLEMPGVTAAVASTYLPMRRTMALRELSIDGQAGQANTVMVTADYFDAMRIPVMRGRAFDASDATGAVGVAIVNEAFVRRWLPDREPLGAMVTFDERFTTGERVIVGVSGDTRVLWSDTRARPEIYLPMSQVMQGSPYFIVSSSREARVSLPADFRRIVERVRPGQLVDLVESYEALLADEASTPRFGAWLLGGLAGLALLLAAGGLAASLAWSVAERRREIGIRMALGARPGQVRGMVLRQTCWLAGIGVAIGLSLAGWTTGWLEGWLYGVVAPTDPATYVGAAVLMMVVAIAAAYLPARRASAVDPQAVLRAD
jgi:putative ABC transport system permease protein